MQKRHIISRSLLIKQKNHLQQIEIARDSFGHMEHDSCTQMSCAIYCTSCHVIINTQSKIISSNCLQSIEICHVPHAHSVKTQVSFAKEPYKRDYILQKRPTFLVELLAIHSNLSCATCALPKNTCLFCKRAL